MKRVEIKKDKTGITLTPFDGINLKGMDNCKEEFYRKRYEKATFWMCGNGTDIFRQSGEIKI